MQACAGADLPVQQRRRALVRGHHLAGDADTPEAAVRGVLALYATDPASVYLSVLARSTRTTLGDVAAGAGRGAVLG